MTAIHDPGDVWHIGWDWHADLWFVEPPFDVELDEPIKWFNQRHEAFEFVDDQIRRQPVQVSVFDHVDSSNVVDATPPPEQTVPYVRATEVPEPQRVARPVHPVYVPPIEEARNPKEARLAQYAATVGLK